MANQKAVNAADPIALVCVNDYDISALTRNNKYLGKMVYNRAGRGWTVTKDYSRATHFALMDNNGRTIRTSIYRFMPVK